MKLTCNLSDYEAATFWLNTLPSSSIMVASTEPLVMCAIGTNCRLKRGSPLSYAERAQRLEAVSDHSAQTLLAALKRFVARRGIPSDVCSDRGKNCKGIANHLKQIFQILRSEEIHNFRMEHPPQISDYLFAGIGYNKSSKYSGSDGPEIIYITYKADPKDILKELIYKLEIGW
ncbi:hypothetical protein TNIN_166971 [Trichonephila inaurata madagascariensis]|uniref:Uncharacterized protein n=1 Tax=Trichonephila inaurata madagascariensis TaxID=2747483 RepID=A0A8X6XJY5_9ARAC|nr:hypothetical protein TNIN_166971 [Trichonephila inaurata madagascariensis]